MIVINTKKNPKLLETFNNDPYSNITVHCQNNITLKLSLSYLSIDSQYFDKVDMDCNSVNLKQLPEKPLIKVLRSLYGEQLVANNIEQLNELYEVIEFLQIQDYKFNIRNYICQKKQKLEQLQLLQFCFKHKILKQEIKQFYFKNKLNLLSDSRNYLKLNKISQYTMNGLLIEFYNSYKSNDSCQQIINSILENYFGRNQIKPNHYFSIQAINKTPGLQILQNIWEKFHHSITYLLSAKETIKQSQMMNNTNSITSHPYHSFGNLSLAGGFSQTANTPNLNMTYTGNFLDKKNGPNNFKGAGTMPKIDQVRKSNHMSSSFIVSNFSQEMVKKDNEIAELQRQLQLKNQIILSLKAQIQNAKGQQGSKQGMTNNPSIKKNQASLSSTPPKIGMYSRKNLMESISDEDEESILQEVKRSKKNLMVPGNQYDTSLIEPAFDQARKINSDNPKQVKTISRLNNRRIFN